MILSSQNGIRQSLEDRLEILKGSRFKSIGDVREFRNHSLLLFLI